MNGSTAIPNRPRHILKVFTPTNEVRPICGSQDPQGLGCPELYLDSNCERCREIEELPEAITKRSLMLALINDMCNIEQMFLDAMYWNFHNPQSASINPDPDGGLAKGWVDHKAQIESMMAKFEPTMLKHEGRFGWPEDLKD